MATTDIANMSRTKLVAGLKNVKARLSSVREAAEVAAQRVTIGASALGGAYAAGYVTGNYQRDGKSFTVGDSEVNWTVPIGAVMAVGGAFGKSFLGESGANIAFGLGIGALAFETGAAGLKAGLVPAGG